MTKAYVSELMPISMRGILKMHGLTTVTVPPCKNLSTELKYHPDLLIFNYKDQIFAEAGTAYSLFENAIPVHGISDKYPKDCILNLLEIDNHIICGKKTLPFLPCELSGKSFITVNQGYVRCSTIRLNNAAYICSDLSIISALMKFNIDILYVDNSDIALNGYSCGFIGGCSGVYDNKLFLSGKSTNPATTRNIEDFTKKHGFDVIYLSNEPLYDYGGIVII